MDAQERDIDNAALLERMAEWALQVRDRVKAWLWFVGFVIFGFVILAMAVAAYTRLNPGWVVAGLVPSAFVFQWFLRKKAQKEWQRYEFARQHFRALLECRKTLQSMSKDERAEVKPEVSKWFLDWCMPGGLEHPVFWDSVEEGVMYPATRRMKLESMGLRSRDDNFPNYKEVEYAWERYGEIDPDRDWIRKLRVLGGYVEPSDRLREALNRWKVKPPDGTKE